MAKLNLLILGGSGFLSGTVSRLAVAQGNRVWTLTRGARTLPPGVTPLIADRQDGAAVRAAVAGAGVHWDLVVDCIGYQAQDAEQDLALFADRADHLIFVSTDFVYDPARRRLPQGEEADSYQTQGYGANKRLAERVLSQADPGAMAWTVVRPCHIYGPGSQLGCLPAHSRDAQLIARLRARETLQLVGGGHFLQQPILAADLARTLLSMAGNPKTHGQIFCTVGPDMVESRTYYQIIADILGVPLTVEELSVADYLAANPDRAPFLCHRIYDMSKLRASGAYVPDTPLDEGLGQQVESLSG